MAPVFGGAVVLRTRVDATTGLVVGMLGTGLGLKAQAAPDGRPVQARAMLDGYCGLPLAL